MMKREWIHTILAFGLALTLMLVMPAFIGMRLTFFAPFLIIQYYKRPLVGSVWFSMVCGVIMDLMASQQWFGMWALNYSLTTLILYRLRHRFFSDSVSTVPLMTAFFGIFSTCIQFFLLLVFERGVTLDLHGFVTDLFLMPVLDGVYAYVFFIAPGIFMPRLKKREYFMERGK